MNPNFSIIIPHYNIPELLVRCLKSIPVREDIQVIVVDDCSPDAETYKERFPDFFSRPYLEWYSTPIGGSAGRARNIGLQHAKGKWLLFADSDDYYVPNMYNILSSHVNDNAEVIYFKADSVDTITLLPSDRQIDRNNSIDAFFSGDVTAKESALWFTVVWGQMISRDFITHNNIRFDETIVSNDVMFAAKVACLSKKLSIQNEVLYVITSRENSLHDSKRKDAKRFIVEQEVALRFHRYISKQGVRRTPPCMLKVIQGAYQTWGMRTAIDTTKMAIMEHALFYGFGEYIKRHIIKL